MCKIKPAEVLKMTLDDIEIVLDEGHQEFNDHLRRHVDLKVSILNSSPFPRKDGRAWRMTDFLPKELIETEELSEEEQARRTLERGRKLAAKSDQYKKRR